VICLFAGGWRSPAPGTASGAQAGAFRRPCQCHDVCQRGPDSFGFTATDRSGFGMLSLREALLSFSRPVLVQSPSAPTLDLVAPRHDTGSPVG